MAATFAMPITTPIAVRVVQPLGVDLEGFGLPRASLPEAVQALSARLGGEGQLHFSDQLSRVALFVSKQDHCLLDLLWRTRAGELPMQVPLVISNHPDLRAIAEDLVPALSWCR